MDAPTDQDGNVLSTFELSIAELREDLVDIDGSDTVEVTLDDKDPTSVVLKFKMGV
jgi:hypothetical protein